MDSPSVSTYCLSVFFLSDSKLRVPSVSDFYLFLFVLSRFRLNSVLRSVPFNADAASVDAVDLGSDKPI